MVTSVSQEDRMYVHPELAGILGRLPARPADPYADIEATRADFKAMMAPLMRGDPRVAVEHADAGGVPVQVLRPAGLPGTLPCVIYIHGGGFAYGELDGPSPMAQQVCAEVGAVVVNVHYRLAPEHRFPAGIEDCYTALCWTADHAADLGTDEARIAVSGASAGGNLSAALCLLARDRGGPAIACQYLLIPITDDRLDRYPSIRPDHRPARGQRGGHRPYLAELPGS
jgi:acetyl esterase